MTRHRLAAAIATLLLAAVGCSQPAPGGLPQHHHGTTSRTHRQAQPRAVSDVLVRHRYVLGYSVEHRPVIAVQIGDPDSPRRILLVGCIHGNEPAGIAIARALLATRVPPEVNLWVVPDLNPDGVHAGTRGNARGVDLNRNFPYRWRPIGAPGSLHYAGSHALSEREARMAARLLRRVRPTLGLWYHQALDVVDTSQGPRALERRYAADTGLPTRRLPDYPGSAIGFEDHLFGPTAFAIELPAGRVSRAELRRHLRAIVDIATRAPIHHALKPWEAA
ncbi:MAG: DUF2817 domain-containing protein [Frankiales bacterium]|nr:DUF2817 domain-containing protein [Frankiales bacterium]